MKMLNKKYVELLDCLIKSELQLIELGFEKSDFLGKVFLRNSITSFEEIYLKNIYVNFIPVFTIEYRYFLIGLLKEIKDEYKHFTISEILIPKIGKVHTDELLNCLKEIETIKC